VIFKVTAKSKKGKARIKEHGTAWELVETRMRVAFSSEAGPWHSLKSTKTGCLRWVNARNDENFIIGD